MAVSYNPSIVKNGLVLYYDFGNIKKGRKVEQQFNVVESDIIDLSGNGNGCNSCNCNQPIFDSSNYGCVSFDAGDPDDLPTKLTTQFNDFSASVWFLPNGVNTSTGGKLIEKIGSNGFSILKGTTSTSWGYTIGSEQFSGGSFSNGIVDAAWNMISISSRLVSTTRTTRLFFNNVHKSSSVKTSSQLSNAPMIIGNSSDCNYPYEGLISIVMVYDRALEDEEVYSNYNALKGRFGL